MRSFRGISACLAAAALALACALALPSAVLADEAEALYDPDAVFAIHLTLPDQGIEELEDEPDEYAETKGTYEIAPTEETPGTEQEPLAEGEVEIRLKGSASFEELDGKAAFKLKFAKGERPLGLKKMTLNNMKEDPSMVHETLAYESFRAAGVPAPRTGFAYVYLNGSDYGMHLNVETLDDQSLERIFGVEFDDEIQHLYEGEGGTDVLPGEETAFDPDEGDEEDLSDLEALIAAVGSSGTEPWSTEVAPYADLGEMTRMWAVEKYIGHWDGYSGQEGAHQPNNYYLYDNSSGQFQMLPWGTDETFMSNHHLPFDGPAGVMFEKCLADAACFSTYWHALDGVLEPIEGLGLPARALELDSLLSPWQVQEEGNGERNLHSRASAHRAAQETAEFATERSAEAEAWLAANAPPGEEEPTGEEKPTHEVEHVGDQGQTGEHPHDSKSGGEVRSTSVPSSPQGSESTWRRLVALHRTRVTGKSVRTRLDVAVAGTWVGQRATFATRAGRRTACVVRSRRRSAGDLVLTCRLRRVARERLRDGKLVLRLVTKVRGVDGTVTRRPRKLTP